MTDSIDNSSIFIGHKQGNVYMIDLNDISSISHSLVVTNAKLNEMGWLWHKSLGHASTHTISKLIKRDLVKGLPRIGFEKNNVCEACQLEK